MRDQMLKRIWCFPGLLDTWQCIVLFYLAEIIGNKKQTLRHFVLGKESCAISIYYADWMPDQVRHDRENFPLSS